MFSFLAEIEDYTNHRLHALYIDDGRQCYTYFCRFYRFFCHV